MSYARKRQRGPSWELRVEIAGRNHYRRVRGSEAQAEAALAAFRAELEDHGQPAALPSTRFGTWAETYLALRPELAAQTMESYRRILTRHLLPALGTRALNRITTGHAIDLQRALLAAGLAPVTVAGAIRLASDVLADAVRARIIPANPFAYVRRVKAGERHRDVIAPEQFGALHRVAPGPIADLLRLGLASGLRRGELLALRWQDVTDDCDTVTVSGSIEVADKIARRKAPKTRAGRRSVALPPLAAGILRRRRLAAREAALAAGRDWRALPVFPRSDGVSWASLTATSRACARELRRVGIADTLHGLRHAHATALLADAANPRAVQARLGHASIKTTLGIYAHVLPRDDAGAAAAIARLMGSDPAAETADGTEPWPLRNA